MRWYGDSNLCIRYKLSMEYRSHHQRCFGRGRYVHSNGNKQRGMYRIIIGYGIICYGSDLNNQPIRNGNSVWWYGDSDCLEQHVLPVV